MTPINGSNETSEHSPYQRISDNLSVMQNELSKQRTAYNKLNDEYLNRNRPVEKRRPCDRAAELQTIADTAIVLMTLAAENLTEARSEQLKLRMGVSS